MLYKLASGVFLIVILTTTLSAQTSSPRNARVAFERDGDLYVLEPESETPILIEELPDDDYGAVWSPDGTMLAYTVLGDDPSNSVKDLKVWDGTQVFDIAAANVHENMPINWTQDGLILYFAAPTSAETELATVYTVAPTARARPQLISDEVPLCVYYNQGTLVQLVEQGLIYSSSCIEYTGNGYTGYDGVIYQPSTRSTVVFGYGLTETRLLSQDQNELIGVVHGLKGDTSIVHVDLTSMEETLLEPRFNYRQIHPSYLALAVDTDGNLYYNFGEADHDLLDSLSEEQITTFANPIRAYAYRLGIYSPDLLSTYGFKHESAIPHNTVSIFRMNPKGRSKALFEDMDAFEINNIRIVNQMLYFSVTNNADAWLQALVDGTLPINPNEAVENLGIVIEPYIEMDVYTVDLTVEDPVPVLILKDAHQFVVGGP